MTVHRVAKRFENAESLQDCSRLGRLQVIKRETVKKTFENDLTLKMIKFTQRKKISVFTVSRAGVLKPGSTDPLGVRGQVLRDP